MGVPYMGVGWLAIKVCWNHFIPQISLSGQGSDESMKSCGESLSPKEQGDILTADVSWNVEWRTGAYVPPQNLLHLIHL